MKGRKDNTTIGRDKDNIKDQTQDRHGQDKTKVSIQHQPYGQAFKNASLKSAFSIISPGLAYMVVYISFGKMDLFEKR